MAKRTAPRPLDLIVSKNGKPADLQAIRLVIQDGLNRAGYGELRRVELKCEGNAVTISGRVPTFYLKQLVQSIALAAPGVERVTNEVRVC